jgi:hypothetical protein
MSKVKEITVNDLEEFQDLFTNKDFRISKAIVEGILSNVDTTDKSIDVLSFHVLDTEEIFDISVERKHFIEALEENLQYYINNELYEECRNITNVIKKLKNLN